MILKRILPLLGIMLVLAGCFRQAEDNFDTIGSQNSDDTVLTQEIGVTIEPTDDIIIIDPNASPDADAQAVDDASPTPRTISPTDADDSEVVASSTPRPVVTSQGIPTATEATFVTPDIVEEVVQPTTTEAPESNEPTLQPTPTAIGGEVVAGDCQYQVQDGDNLFRISLNNDVALDELLSANGLTEASVIQPGQLLDLPNCDGGEITVPDETVDTEVEDTPLVLEDCDYEIQSGDSLFNIALDNDVVLADLLAENGLTEDSGETTSQEITEKDLKFFYLTYQLTYLKRGHKPHLNEAFFKQTLSNMNENMLLVIANDEQEDIACALFFYDDEQLFGRYWGCIKQVNNLHFELCYYQGIEFCINNKLQKFNPGTQGEHKIQRGFEPIITYSYHWIKHRVFKEPIKNFCLQEQKHMLAYQQQCRELLPFKNKLTK